MTEEATPAKVRLTDGLGAWQPIETAPATRTLLVWHREYGAVTAHILAGNLWGVYTPGVPMLFQKHLKPAPTHWMHRPEAPNAELTGPRVGNWSTE